MNNISDYILEKLKINSKSGVHELDNRHLFELLNLLKKSKENAVIFDDEELQKEYHIDKMTISINEYTGYITLDKIIIKDKEMGYGTMFMQDLCKWCDMNHRILTLTPTTDFGSSKQRLKKFYKNFGFIENKGTKSNFNTKDTMYRKPK